MLIHHLRPELPVPPFRGAASHTSAREGFAGALPTRDELEPDMLPADGPDDE